MQLTNWQRITLFLVSLFLALVLNAISLHAADESYIIRSNVSEVRLAFAASDHQGRIVQDLRAGDVAVADDGTIIRQFRSFHAASESPLDLVILLDASDSVATEIPAEIAEVKSFIGESKWDERDRVSVITFGGMQAELLCARNCRNQAAQQKLSSLRAKGATPLYDALFEASKLLKRDHDPESRTAMILFSDGLDTISMHGLSDITAAAQNLQSAIYSINSRSRKSALDRGDEVLNYLAANTGGLSFPSGQVVPEVLCQILTDLHSGYVLTYQMPGRTSGQHSVRILPTSDPKLQFRSRQAYIGNE